MKVLQDTYKDTKIGRIPKDWDVIKLSEVVDILNNKRKPLNSSQRNSISGDVPYYGANGQVDSINDFIFNEPLILMAEDGGNFSEYEFRHIAYKITGKSWVNNHAHVLKPKSDFDFDYVFYELEHKNILRFINGSTRTKLNQGDLKGIPLKIPPLQEQQKIAAILSTVDEQISTIDKIIEKSKELKKGLMQKLFSEGIGHTEFKDTKVGRIPKDWEVKSLEEVGLIKVGRDLNKEIYNPTLSKEHKVRVYSNAITDRGLYGFYSRSEYPKNSITITGRGDIGYAFARNEEFGAIGRLIVIHPNSNVDYIYLTNYINHSVNFHIETSGIPQLTGVQASKYKVAIPPLPEQQKIAAILSEADAKIEKEQIQKAQLQALKKGLMQQLLTGKKRVKV